MILRLQRGQWNRRRIFPRAQYLPYRPLLGKETVQNLLALRFANRMINSQWDNTCIDHIQITAAETVGIEGRWSYYDKVGQLRDMVQNHLLQLLCMVAMGRQTLLEQMKSVPRRSKFCAP